MILENPLAALNPGVQDKLLWVMENASDEHLQLRAGKRIMDEILKLASLGEGSDEDTRPPIMIQVTPEGTADVRTHPRTTQAQTGPG